MMAYFLRYFPTLADGGDLKAPVKFSTWLHEPGFPLFEPDLSDAKDMMDACESLLYYWQSSYVPIQANVLYLTMESKTWHVNQVLYFIDLCVEAQFAHAEVIVELGDALGFFHSTNAEILFRWSQVLIKNAVVHKMGFVGNFLTIQGKQKFLIPIYRLLVASSNNTIQRFALEIYEKTKPTLHVMVRDRIEAILKSIA
jgi:aminopeptidase B